MLDNEFYVVGVYENLQHDIFPTHLSPIIVERTELGFRRWHYKILSPYGIEPMKPIGEFHETLIGLFPYPSYSFIEPRKVTIKSQIVGFSHKEIFVESNRLFMIYNLLKSVLRNYKKFNYLKRAKFTLFNIIT
ncbi:hypothetical protein ERW49_18230 [Aliivibrio finisterrensis]|uniref:Uncharacterized protein n=1 Tax=Aliivibrio finisterrensis TaxID=511998 RepID=A0A4Q5K8D8_9GAMM|nr:hypothetical protein [Aliivibrio finisterrensis]RYU42116.1 hypothetical protein ERW49_18230 [Aliivibrio finisterrensis]